MSEKLERCANCDGETGRAGKLDDSLYCKLCDAGPFCEECADVHGTDNDCPDKQPGVKLRIFRRCKEHCPDIYFRAKESLRRKAWRGYPWRGFAGLGPAGR